MPEYEAIGRSQGNTLDGWFGLGVPFVLLGVYLFSPQILHVPALS